MAPPREVKTRLASLPTQRDIGVVNVLSSFVSGLYLKFLDIAVVNVQLGVVTT